jgi:heme exporter protein C
MIQDFFKPSFFTRLIQLSKFWVAVLTVILGGTGLYMALFASPADYQQGEAVRMMYVHVPAAWMALGVYLGLAVCGINRLAFRNPFFDVLGTAAAPIGMMFTFICLVTGSIWGKPMWGTWWVWDARLTSVLVLFFFSLGYVMLANAFDRKEQAGVPIAILSIVGVINIPIIKFSVDWWNTLHQPASIMRAGGIAIDDSMLWPLLLMFLFYISFFFLVFFMRVEKELLQRKIDRIVY